MSLFPFEARLMLANLEKARKSIERAERSVDQDDHATRTDLDMASMWVERTMRDLEPKTLEESA